MIIFLCNKIQKKKKKLKIDKRPTSFVLENKRQEFRKADTRSLRIKEIEIKLSHSMCDLHEALTTQEQLPKFRGRRRFSEPINLATYNHIPISPLILSKSQPENPKDLFPVKKHTKKTRSFSLYILIFYFICFFIYLFILFIIFMKFIIIIILF